MQQQYGTPSIPRGVPDQWSYIQAHPRQRAWIYGEHWQSGDARHRFWRMGADHARRLVRVCRACGQPYRVQGYWSDTHREQVVVRAPGNGKARLVRERFVAGGQWRERTHPRLCPVCAAGLGMRRGTRRRDGRRA